MNTDFGTRIALFAALTLTGAPMLMGQYAARIDDTTALGGTILTGEPTVCIGGKPAATVDSSVLYVPQGTSPILEGCPTVLVGGRPLSRVGDLVMCPALPPAQPYALPDHIASGCVSVIVGSSLILSRELDVNEVSTAVPEIERTTESGAAHLPVVPSATARDPDPSETIP